MQKNPNLKYGFFEERYTVIPTYPFHLIPLVCMCSFVINEQASIKIGCEFQVLLQNTLVSWKQSVNEEPGQLLLYQRTR